MSPISSGEGESADVLSGLAIVADRFVSDSLLMISLWRVISHSFVPVQSSWESKKTCLPIAVSTHLCLRSNNYILRNFISR